MDYGPLAFRVFLRVSRASQSMNPASRIIFSSS
jgi:hypothetical protein